MISISGGYIDDIVVNEDSVVNISGGAVNELAAMSGSLINVTGGIFGEFQARTGSTVSLFGTQFVLDGTDITATLIENSPHVISVRGVVLSGILSDGSPFDFNLSPTTSSVGDFFNSGATLAITLTLAPGDFNRDRKVDAADYIVWRKNGGTQDAYDTWRANFGTTADGNGGSSSASSFQADVPEPPAAFVVVICLVATAMRRNRRS